MVRVIALARAAKSILHIVDGLDHGLQKMLTFRQELAQRYEQINTLLSDLSSLPTEEICLGKICGLIEADQENSSQNYSNR